MSGATEQVMSVLGFCEKSRAHLSPDISIEHGALSLMGQKALPHKDQKALFLKGGQVPKLP